MTVAVTVELLGNEGEVVEYAVADNETIEKGTLCKISGSRTCAAGSATGDIFAGIATSEKVALDGSLTLGLYTKGIFDIVVNGATTIGTKVKLSGANTVSQCDTDTMDVGGGQVVGTILETGVGGTAAEVAIGVYG